MECNTAREMTAGGTALGQVAGAAFTCAFRSRNPGYPPVRARRVLLEPAQALFAARFRVIALPVCECNVFQALSNESIPGEPVPGLQAVVIMSRSCTALH